MGLKSFLMEIYIKLYFIYYMFCKYAGRLATDMSEIERSILRNNLQDLSKKPIFMCN